MMDIYHKALKNPEPPKKTSSTNKAPPDYHNPVQPPPPLHASLLLPTHQTHAMTLPPLQPSIHQQPGPQSIPSTSTYVSHLAPLQPSGQMQQSQQMNYNYTTSNNSNNSSMNSGSDNQIKNSVMKKKKNSRRKHRNSHLGCGTCKKRRIKCDETLPACLNCLKGKLHCAYLNLDNNARNALRIAQYNQNIRQEKLDSNGKFIDELRGAVGPNSIENNGMPQPGMMSAQRPQPLTVAAGSSGITAYPLTAGNVLPPNIGISAAAAAAAASSASIPPFINSVIAPGIQPPSNNSTTSPTLNTTNPTADTVHQGRTPPQHHQTQQLAPQQQQQAAIAHIQPSHVPSPQIVQSPYGPLVPVLTQTGSVVYAPTSSLATQHPQMIATTLPPQPAQPAIQTLPLPIPQQSVTQPTIVTGAPQPQLQTAPAPATAPTPTTLQKSQPLSNPPSVPHLSPVLSQQPSMVPITSNAGSVANIASQNIRLSVDKTEAALKGEGTSNVLPPINTIRNSANGKSPTTTSATSNSTATEKSPIVLPGIPNILSPTNNDNRNGNNEMHSNLSTTSSLKEETNDKESNNVKLPSINILKRETSKSPPSNGSGVEEEKVSISNLIS